MTYYVLIENNDTVWGVFRNKKMAFQAFQKRVIENAENFLERLEYLQKIINTDNQEMPDEETNTVTLYDSNRIQTCIYNSTIRVEGQFDIVEEGQYVPFGPYAGHEDDTYELVQYYLEVEQELEIPQFEIFGLDSKYYYTEFGSHNGLLKYLNQVESKITDSQTTYKPVQKQILYVIYENERIYAFAIGIQDKPLFDKYCKFSKNISVKSFKGKTDTKLNIPFTLTDSFSKKDWKSKCISRGVTVLGKKTNEDVARGILKKYLGY